MTKNVVKIDIDANELISDLDELAAALNSPEMHIVRQGITFGEIPFSSEKFFVLTQENDPGEIKLRVRPTDLLLKILADIRSAFSDHQNQTE